jgi:uracil-DNA glycosylase
MKNMMNTPSNTMENLLAEVRGCVVCANALGHEPRPVLAAHRQSKIAIIGQAPGSVVHRTGVPWDDKSGENLRRWMGIDNATFYDAKQIALIPMGFCYPGKGKSGDLPPRKECAPLWHLRLFEEMKQLRLILLVGKYAQDYYLKEAKKTLTATVRNFEEYLPDHFVLPHPSPRNNIWQAKNSWFSAEVLPVLGELTSTILNG